MCFCQWHHSRPPWLKAIIDFLRPGNVCLAQVCWVDQPTQDLHIGSQNEDESTQRSNEEGGSLPMAAKAWGHLQGCKAVSGSSCLSSSFWPQPPHLPGYRCIEVAWVGIHACAAWATKWIILCISMWFTQPKASQGQLHHLQTRVFGYSVGSREIPILPARLGWLLDPNWSSATPKAIQRSCQPADFPILGKASPVLVRCVLASVIVYTYNYFYIKFIIQMLFSKFEYAVIF